MVKTRGYALTAIFLLFLPEFHNIAAIWLYPLSWILCIHIAIFAVVKKGRIYAFHGILRKFHVIAMAAIYALIAKL